MILSNESRMRLSTGLFAQPFKRAVLTALALASLAACAPKAEPETPPQKRRLTNANYDLSKCVSNPGEGDQALSYNLGVDDFVLARYFQKKYDRADLAAVLSASLVSTANYVRSMGIGVYRIRRTTGDVCPMFACLEDVPDDYQRVWDQHASGYPEGVLAGLYFEYCDSDCQDHALTRPTILVDEAADRWTLVHEMMHHNFNRTRKGDPNELPRRAIEAQRDTSITEVNSLYAAYKISHSPDDLRKLAMEASNLARAEYALLVRTDFEEIAVEGLLVDEFARGTFTSVTREAASSAVGYMEKKRQDGLQSLFWIRPLLSMIRAEAAAQQWTDVQAIAEGTEAFIKGIDRNARELVESASRSIGIFDVPAPADLGSRSLFMSTAHVSHDPHTEKLVSEESRAHWEREKAKLLSALYDLN